jgi:hypothetical protein
MEKSDLQMSKKDPMLLLFVSNLLNLRRMPLVMMAKSLGILHRLFSWKVRRRLYTLNNILFQLVEVVVVVAVVVDVVDVVVVVVVEVVEVAEVEEVDERVEIKI